MTAPPWYTKGTVWCAVCIVCLVFVGIALFAGSWASRYALESYTHHTIIDTILVDSPVLPPIPPSPHPPNTRQGPSLSCLPPPPTPHPPPTPSHGQSSPAFDRWRRNYGDDRGSANLHQYFIFCNVTNVEQVLGEGALPVVQEVGPYAYWCALLPPPSTFVARERTEGNLLPYVWTTSGKRGKTSTSPS